LDNHIFGDQITVADGKVGIAIQLQNLKRFANGCVGVDFSAAAVKLDCGFLGSHIALIVPNYGSTNENSHIFSQNIGQVIFADL